jgi:hypothetical protein
VTDLPGASARRERAILEGPVEELCARIDWET